jgi:tRNA A37 threonylcarbamoyladenosine dehydratase
MLVCVSDHPANDHDSVGIPKVEAVARHFKKIIPWIEVEAYPEMFR